MREQGQMARVHRPRQLRHTGIGNSMKQRAAYGSREITHVLSSCADTKLSFLFLQLQKNKNTVFAVDCRMKLLYIFNEWRVCIVDTCRQNAKRAQYEKVFVYLLV
jgi:hypothetical protein